MAKFVKGVSGNPAGRKKNSEGVKTLERKNRARNMLNAIEKIYPPEKLVKLLTPREAAMLYRDLQEFDSPKLSRQENVITENRVEVKQVFVIGGKEIEL